MPGKNTKDQLEGSSRPIALCPSPTHRWFSGKEKQKYSLSASRFAIRFDKNLGIASAENEKNEKIAGGGSLALKDLPMHFPVTSLKVAACLKEVVARISVIDTFHKENTHSRSRSSKSDCGRHG